MIDIQTDKEPILVYDPASDVVGSYQSEFYTALWSTFDVDHTDSVEELAAESTASRYAAVVYRWRSSTIEDLESVLDSLPEPFSIPFIVAGPDDPTAVRNVLVTDADGYVPVGAESASKLEARIDTETPMSKTAGAEAVDTSALHEAIVEQMQDSAWVLDSELRISYVNDRLIDRLSLSASDLIGQPLADVFNETLLESPAYGRFEQGLRELLDGNREQFRIQLTHHPDDAPTYTTDVLARPYLDSDDEIVGIVGIGRDITEQLAEQRRMERQNDLFRQAEQLATIGGWAWDLDDNAVEVTDQVYEIYELPNSFDPTIENILQYHPDPSNAVREAFDGLRAGEPADLEARLRTPAGDHKWVRIHGSPKETDGEVTEIIGSVQDITERRRLETQLRENVDSLRQLYQLSADTTLSFADRIDRVLELTCDRLDLRYGVLSTIEDDQRQIVSAHGDHDRLQPGATAPLSESYCRKTVQQDSLFTLENAPEEGWADDPAYQRFELDCYLGGNIRIDSRLYGTLWFADDDPREQSFTETELAFVEVLTKWVSYQLERRSTESKLRELQETTQEFLTADDDGAVAELAMEAAAEILELPLTALWQHDDEEDALLPITQTEEADAHFESQPRFESGEGLIWKAYAMNSVVVVDDVQGEPDRYSTDTEIKSEIIVPVQSYGVLVTATLEQREFTDLEVDLLRILAASVSAAMVRVEREVELQRQNDRLSEFTGYVSHDLRNPLSVAQGYIDQVKTTGNTETLAAVERAHDRMQTLIDDMLLLARKGEIIDMVGPTRVETIAEWAWESVDSRDATLEIGGELTVEADAPRLQQVFENLFRNSVEHGGPALTITVECHDDWFAVADDGHGFEDGPPRLDSDTHESESGLGLSIVAKIVEAHGWEITAQDGADGGSRFEITGAEPVDPEAEDEYKNETETTDADSESSVDH
jgi:PAS domain S-box-containing protein